MKDRNASENGVCRLGRSGCCSLISASFMAASIAALSHSAVIGGLSRKVTNVLDVEGRLTAPDLPARLARLGLRPEDRADALAAARAVIAAGDQDRVAILGERLRPGIGDLEDR